MEYPLADTYVAYTDEDGYIIRFTLRADPDGSTCEHCYPNQVPVAPFYFAQDEDHTDLPYCARHAGEMLRTIHKGVGHHRN